MIMILDFMIIILDITSDKLDFIYIKLKNELYH